MLSIQELRSLGASLSLDVFRQQLGPFALIQRPAGADSPKPLASTLMANPGEVELGILTLLFQFEELLVVTLPPLDQLEVLTVGRQPDCELMLDHPSVSKRHAQLTWKGADGVCTVKDLGSTNGTFLNASTIAEREVALRDGDIVSFGNAQFWYLLTDTLHTRLRAGPPMSAGG